MYDLTPVLLRSLAQFSAGAASTPGQRLFLSLGQQMHGQAPDRQSTLGLLEDGAAGHAALVLPTTALLVQPALAAKRRPRRSVPLRAGEALRPAGEL